MNNFISSSITKYIFNCLIYIGQQGPAGKHGEPGTRGERGFPGKYLTFINYNNNNFENNGLAVYYVFVSKNFNFKYNNLRVPNSKHWLFFDIIFIYNLLPKYV